jgi:hypothetical protein
MKKKQPDDMKYFLNELADQLRVDNSLFKLVMKYIENKNDELTTMVGLNIELTEDKWGRALERIETSF